MQREQMESIEASLRQVAGIQSARIRADGESISEVHVVAQPDRKAKGVVRDVVTTLFARHGIDLHHHKVSVATTSQASETVDGQDLRLKRLIFRCVNIYRDANRYEGQVELMEGERVLAGTASGPAVRNCQERLVAQACLQAVSRLFAEGMALDLLGLERVRIGNREAILSHLVILRGRSETHLLGSALVAADSLEATVFSVLDALNRVLPAMVGEDTVEYEVEECFPETGT